MMTSLNVTKQITDAIKEQASDDELLEKFLLELFRWELSTKGAFQFKDSYRQMVKQYCSEWTVDKCESNG